MAISEAFSGIETVSTTEWSLVNDSSTIAANTTAGVYQLHLDCNAITVADIFELKVYEKVLSGGTQKVVWRTVLPPGGQSPILSLPNMMLMRGWDFSIVKISGTDRSIEWSIRRLANVTEEANGSQTIGTTEWSLLLDSSGIGANGSDGIIQLWLDVDALTNTEIYLLRQYERVRSGGTQRTEIFQRIFGPDFNGNSPVWFSPAMTLMHAWDWTLDKLSGTDRAIDWSIRRVS